MKPIAPEQRDSIPREVATAMLSEPRARLTNRMRKNCVSAREKVFASTSSIVGQWVSEEDSENDKWMLLYTERDGRSPEDRMKRRFAIATLRQLGNWLRRSIARREIVQRRYLAVPNSDVPKFQARFDAARQALVLLAEWLDCIRDVCEDEIAMRKNKCNKVIAVCSARIGAGKSVRFIPA